MITYIIIGITVIISLLAFNYENLMPGLVFNPYVIDKRNQYYRFITSGFIHADMMHLFFNMYALFLFGGIVENKLFELFGMSGMWLFAGLYISALFMSSTFSFYKHRENPHYNALGASGAVSAVLFASIIIYPTQELMIFPIPFFIPSYILGPLYLAYTYYMSNKNLDNIGHDAHFFGALWGILFIVVLWHDALSNFLAQLPFLQ
jgi:membrane associated rhomboid family serine protease